MEDLISFFGEVIVMSAVAGLLLSLAPEGSQKKYIRFAVALTILAALVGPMLSAVASLPRILDEMEIELEGKKEEQTGNIEDALIEAARKNIEENVLSMLVSRFSISAAEISVEVDLDASDPQSIEILEVKVHAPNLPVVRRSEMKRYLEEAFMESTKIIVQE